MRFYLFTQDEQQALIAANNEMAGTQAGGTRMRPERHNTSR